MEIVIAEDIKLCAIALEDADAIFEIIDNQREYLQEWLPFVPFTVTCQDTKDFIQSVIEVPDGEIEPTFTIRKGRQIVGLIGFRDSDYINRKTEIGYWISSACQGQGIVTRATKRLCEYAFDHLGMNRVQIRCGVGNTRSSAIPKRLGFTFEGIAREAEYHPDNRFIDLEVYSLLYSDLEDDA